MHGYRLKLTFLMFIAAIGYLVIRTTGCKIDPVNDSLIPSQSVTSSEVILNEAIARPYPADNWWNLNIADAPVDANSSGYINWIGAGKTLHPDWGQSYGIPYCTVGSGQPDVAITFWGYPSESDPGPYPLPAEARTDPRYIEQGSDGHMIVYNRDTRELYEMFRADWDGAWNASCGAYFQTDWNHRRPDGWTSADAAGLAILPGLVKWHEVNGAEPIRHAHRFTLRATNGYVWPASHAAGTTQGALPMGARLRLKGEFPLTGYIVPVQRLLQSFKDYGLILADNGSDMFITGTQDERWTDMAAWNAVLATVHAGDFEVIELGWQPSVTGIKDGTP